MKWCSSIESQEGMAFLQFEYWHICSESNLINKKTINYCNEEWLTSIFNKSILVLTFDEARIPISTRGHLASSLENDCPVAGFHKVILPSPKDFVNT
jgi:hypothetical protein